jgi:hypothetical protein
MKKQIILTLSLISSLAALASCSEIPKQAYYNRGQPESLLDVASEQVSVDLRQRNGLMQLTDAVNRNKPSSAQLTCSNRMLCERAAEILDQYNVSYRQVNGVANTVTLNYQSIVARDCENRYIDNHINPYNLNHPTFGCSIAVNQVQMVSDKRQFIDPQLLGEYDGSKAAQNYDTYQSREAVVINVQSASGGGSSGGGSQ